MAGEVVGVEEIVVVGPDAVGGVVVPQVGRVERPSPVPTHPLAVLLGASLVVPLEHVAPVSLEALDVQPAGVVALLDEGVLVPLDALPAGAQVGALLEAPVFVVVRLAVAVPVIADPALEVFALVLVAPVEASHVVGDPLVLHAVVVQGEWGGWLLARALEVEVVPTHSVEVPVPGAVRLVLVELDLDVHVAGEVVGLEVPVDELVDVLALGVAGRVERVELGVVVVPAPHVLVDLYCPLDLVLDVLLEV